MAGYTRTKFERFLPWLLVIGGVIGLVCSFVIMFEKIQLLGNQNYNLSCDVNSIISCGSVMQSDQAEVFGFANTFVGLVSFAALITIGMALFAGAKLKKWFWVGLQLGTVLGLMFVHWLFYQSVYVINALCLYCMVVWAVTIAIFWYVTLYNLRMNHIRIPGKLLGTEAFIQRHHIDILVLWYLIIAVFILHHFWYYFGTLI